MVNYYFEINDNIADRIGGKYYTTSSFVSGDLFWHTLSHTLMQYSDRAWCEQDGRVWFVKHRTELSPIVDMKEFMWVKLKAESALG